MEASTARTQGPVSLAARRPSRPSSVRDEALVGRIAHVLLRYVEVSETFVPDAILELDRLGWRGTVVTTQVVNRDQFGYPPESQIRLARRPSLRRRLTNRVLLRNLSQRQAYWFQPELAALSPDLVHAHFGHVATAAVPATARLGLPLVVSLHGTDVTAARNEDKWAPGGYGAVFRHAACIVVPSQFLAEKLGELGYRERVEIIPAGIRLDRLPFTGPPADSGRDRVKLLLVARQVPVKGTDVLLRALPDVLAHYPRARLDVIGPLETDAAANARLVAQLGIGHAVRFHGAQSHDRTLAAIRAAHLVVVPSRRAPNGDEESSSLVTREALATGVPMVATASGGIAENFPPVYHHELVIPDDPAALAAQIRAVLEDREGWPERTTAGRAWIESHFDSAQLAQRMGAVYEDVIAEHAAKPRDRA